LTASDQLNKAIDGAKALCESVKEARGGKTASQLQADVQAKAPGFWKLFDIGGGAKGSIDRETFEGLTQETKSVDVSIGSVVNDNFTYTIGSNTLANMMYKSEIVTFTAGASNTLSFASQDAGAFGPVIGNVSISAVPEPSTWAMMLVGFLGLGFAFRQSRRKVSFA
jgi:hypothetical protein